MNDKLKATLLMIGSAACFSLMQTIISATSDTIPLFEQLFFRNLIATGIAFSGIRSKHLPLFGKKENRLLLTGRSFCGYVGMMMTFYASANANIGDVTIITRMSPFVVTILAYFFLKEKITKYQVIALFVAVFGAFFVANPQFNSNLLPIFAAFLACIFSGVAYVFIGALKGKEEPEVIIFFFSISSTVVTLPLLLIDFVIPSIMDFILLVGIGVAAALGQICLTYSYKFAKASEVSIYHYAGIIFSMLFGIIFLGEALKITSLFGAFFVILAGCIVFFGSQKLEHKDKV